MCRTSAAVFAAMLKPCTGERRRVAGSPALLVALSSVRCRQPGGLVWLPRDVVVVLSTTSLRESRVTDNLSETSERSLCEWELSYKMSETSHSGFPKGTTVLPAVDASTAPTM